MATTNYLKSRLKEFEISGAFSRDKNEKLMANAYLNRARHNLVVMTNSIKISNLENVKNALNLPIKFNQFDWVVIQGYYAMYMAALACLAKVGLKSRDHTATSIALELFFVRKGLLEKKYLDILKKMNVELEKEFVKMIRRTKRRRRTAQYDVGSFIQKQEATRVEKDSIKFVDRLAKLFNEIKDGGK